MPPIDPINVPQQLPQNLSGAETLRNDSHGSGGGSGGRRNAPEPEPEPEEEQAPDAKLDGDSFARRRSGGNLDTLFADKMPWEQEEDEKKRKLEEFRLKRLQGPAAGRKGTAGPAPIPTVKPPAHPLSGAKGRQVDGSFDATSAVNTTMSAWQNLRDRQAQDLAAEAIPERAGTGTGSLAHPLAGPLLGRTPIPPAPGQPGATDTSKRPQAAPYELQIEQGPHIPPAPVRPQEAPKVKTPTVVLPEPFILEDEPPAATVPQRATGTSRLPALPPREVKSAAPRSVQEVRKPLGGTGALATPSSLDPARIPRKAADVAAARATQTPAADAAAARTAQHQAVPTAPGPKELGSAVASWRSAGGPAPEKAPPPAAAPVPTAPPNVTQAMPPPSWAVKETAEAIPVFEPVKAIEPEKASSKPEALVPEPVEVDRKGAPAVRASASLAAFTYRVMDATTGKPMMDARLELEPLENDMLPVLNGVSDFLGWWGSSNVAPGAYRLSARSAGYIPAFETRVLAANLADDVIMVLAKP